VVGGPMLRMPAGPTGVSTANWFRNVTPLRPSTTTELLRWAAVPPVPRASKYSITGSPQYLRMLAGAGEASRTSRDLVGFGGPEPPAAAGRIAHGRAPEAAPHRDLVSCKEGVHSRPSLLSRSSLAPSGHTVPTETPYEVLKSRLPRSPTMGASVNNISRARSLPTMHFQ